MPSIQSIIDYAERIKPGVKPSLIPALDEDIRRYEVLIGTRVPDEYGEMLRMMGMNCGSLDFDNAILDIQQLNARYTAFKPSHDRRYILIAIDRGDMYMDYYLDLGQSERENIPVVRFDYEVEDPDVIVEFSSLFDWICYTVFNQFTLDQYAKIKKCVLRNDTTDVIAKIDQILKDIGFESAIDSSPTMITLVRSDAAVMAYYHEGENLILMNIGSNASYLCEEIWRSLESRL